MSEKKEFLISEFADWLRNNSSILKNKAAEVIADEICEQLLKVDPGLGVEVSILDENNIEAIITAFSNLKLFPVVNDIVSKLIDIEGWNFISLKQARGFEFSIDFQGAKLNAANLKYVEIADVPNGFKLIPSDINFDLSDPSLEELAWLIIETGIGEILASKIGHLEFSNNKSSKQQFSIGKLAARLS